MGDFEVWCGGRGGGANIEMNIIVVRCDYVNCCKVTSVYLLLANTKLRWFCVVKLEVVAVGGGFL
jgi:hypothetical protein